MKRVLRARIQSTAYAASFAEKLTEEREKRGDAVLEAFLPKDE